MEMSKFEMESIKLEKIKIHLQIIKEAHEIGSLTKDEYNELLQKALVALQ